MSKLVVLNLGGGDLLTGFPQVTARLWSAVSSLPEQSVGSLAPAPKLIELYRTWQSTYHCLCNFQTLRSNVPTVEEDLLQIDEVGITNISYNSLELVSHELCEELNAWLSRGNFFKKIERHMRSQLHPTEDIRIILETNDELLRHLPWHKWDFFQDYPKADLALSQSDYKCRQFRHTQFLRDKIRILAILGDRTNIDVKAEKKFLQNLPNAETTFLVNPSCHEFNEELWSPLGWDILFFAGHSRTEEKTGRLYINENSTNNSIAIERLEEALKASIERGLMLTIFNSCDGLGLASALEKLHIPVVVVMREPVPNQVAQEFLRYFLEAFAIDRLSFNRAMRRSCRKLQGLEVDFPGASWLPISCQNPAIKLPTWSELSVLWHQSLRINPELKLTADRLVASNVARESKSQLESDAIFEIDTQQASIFTPEQFSRIEEILTDLIGPIATVWIQQFEAHSLNFEELLAKLSTYLCASQITEFERQITPLLQEPTKLTTMPVNNPIVFNEPEITDVLVCEYEQALAEIIGPVAGFVVQNALASPQISRVKLIEILSSEIIDPQKAAEFKQQLIDST